MTSSFLPALCGAAASGLLVALVAGALWMRRELALREALARAESEALARRQSDRADVEHERERRREAEGIARHWRDMATGPMGGER